jgi:hypothetical protein
MTNHKTGQGCKPEVCEIFDFLKSLTAVQITLLTIYDMFKTVGGNLALSLTSTVTNS